MSTNISKQKREDLLAKIKEIRTFISNAPQDENTGNLLSYLSDLEKDVNGKKYGLVFEEHREEIDEVLDTHTPVLTENRDLFIDNGGQMNFLIEGDNLASLKLLEKTHKGKIDLIYIDPPYNTQNADFMYDDTFVAADDLYRHSKWLSFMKKRLLLCRKLLASRGFIFISIDDNEAPHLKALCDEIFGEDNYEKTDYIQVRYPDKTLKSDMRYHKEIEQVLVYRKSFMAKPYLKPQEYDYDKFIYSINELSAGKEIELGGKKVVVFEQGEYEIVQHDTGFKDGLKEIWATGTILNGNSSGRFFRDYLDGRKDIDGLGILYIKDDFMLFADRHDIDDEVEIWLKRPKGAKKFPDNLIKAYYADLQSNNRIKKISVKGTNASGQFEIDTDLMKMKHYLSVAAEAVTNEVNSLDFFRKAQEFIEETRNKK